MLCTSMQQWPSLLILLPSALNNVFETILLLGCSEALQSRLESRPHTTDSTYFQIMTHECVSAACCRNGKCMMSRTTKSAALWLWMSRDSASCSLMECAECTTVLLRGLFLLLGRYFIVQSSNLYLKQIQSIQLMMNYTFDYKYLMYNSIVIRSRSSLSCSQCTPVANIKFLCLLTEHIDRSFTIAIWNNCECPAVSRTGSSRPYRVTKTSFMQTIALSACFWNIWSCSSHTYR